MRCTVPLPPLSSRRTPGPIPRDLTRDMADSCASHSRRWLWVPAQGRDDTAYVASFAGSWLHVPAARSAPELCLLTHPHRTGGRREGRAPAAPVARLLKKMQAAGTTGSAEIARPSLRDGLHAYMQASWRSGFLAAMRDNALAHIVRRYQRRGIRTLQLHVRKNIVRPHIQDMLPRTCCEPSRPPLPAPRVVTIARNAPS